MSNDFRYTVSIPRAGQYQPDEVTTVTARELSNLTADGVDVRVAVRTQTPGGYGAATDEFVRPTEVANGATVVGVTRDDGPYAQDRPALREAVTFFGIATTNH